MLGGELVSEVGGGGDIESFLREVFNEVPGEAVSAALAFGDGVEEVVVCGVECGLAGVDPAVDVVGAVGDVSDFAVVDVRVLAGAGEVVAVLDDLDGLVDGGVVGLGDDGLEGLCGVDGGCLSWALSACSGDFMRENLG